jgi:iron complex transport system substrate-binding protein
MKISAQYIWGLGLLTLAAAAGWGVMTARDQTEPPSSAADRAIPQRIVSINLCTDQLLIAIADRHQIAGVTQFAADPAMSALAQQAVGLRALAHSGEDLLRIAPDVLIGMPATGGPQARLFDGQGLRIVDVPFVTKYSEIAQNLRLVGDVTGHRDRAEALVANMGQRLAAIPANGRGRVAAYYQRRGFVTGAGTLVDDMMQRVGLTNLATKLGKPALAQMSLEEMVAAEPDFLIVEAESRTVTDQGSEMLQHPALSNIPRLSITEALTVCGGPEYPAAIQALTDQIALNDRKAG